MTASPRAPILVTGGHRSGTGWVGQVLAASPTPIGYVWEPFSVRHRPGTCAARFPHWFPYLNEANANGVERAIADTLAFRYRPLAELRALRSPRDGGRMVRDWWRFERERRRHATPLLKDPIAIYSAEWLADRFGMDVVVLIRHPAAFTASIKRLNWTHRFADFLAQPELMEDLLAPYADEIRRYAEVEQDIVDQGILLWLVLHEAIARYQERRPQWIYVRLEDLSRDPLPHFRRLFEQLGIAWDARVEELVLATSGPANPAEASRLDSVHRDSAAHIWNWKRRLTGEEVARVRARTEPLASRFYGEEDW
jgi:hypothetical protein